VEIPPIRFPIACDVFWSHLCGLPGEVPEPSLRYGPLIRGLVFRLEAVGCSVGSRSGIAADAESRRLDADVRRGLSEERS